MLSGRGWMPNETWAPEYSVAQIGESRGSWFGALPVFGQGRAGTPLPAEDRGTRHGAERSPRPTKDLNHKHSPYQLRAAPNVPPA